MPITSKQSRPTMGYVKWGFILAFNCLYRGLSFEDSMLESLVLGGDTDTNCAIVGGLVGAARGVP